LKNAQIVIYLVQISCCCDEF